MNRTSEYAAQNLQSFTTGSAGCTLEALPRIPLNVPLSGNVVVSDDAGQLFCINANNGTIRRLRWE